MQLQPQLELLITPQQPRRALEDIRAAILGTLDVLRQVVEQARQAEVPILSPRPRRVVDVDQMTEATSRMADNAEETERWREIKRSFAVRTLNHYLPGSSW